MIGNGNEIAFIWSVCFLNEVGLKFLKRNMFDMLCDDNMGNVSWGLKCDMAQHVITKNYLK